MKISVHLLVGGLLLSATCVASQPLQNLPEFDLEQNLIGNGSSYAPMTLRFPWGLDENSEQFNYPFLTGGVQSKLADPAACTQALLTAVQTVLDKLGQAWVCEVDRFIEAQCGVCTAEQDILAHAKNKIFYQTTWSEFYPVLQLMAEKREQIMAQGFEELGGSDFLLNWFFKEDAPFCVADWVAASRILADAEFLIIESVADQQTFNPRVFASMAQLIVQDAAQQITDYFTNKETARLEACALAREGEEEGDASTADDDDEAAYDGVTVYVI